MTQRQAEKLGISRLTAEAGRLAESSARRVRAFACGMALRSRRRGISLAEMMIAIVILGLGLLMVASLFPVSWLSARRLAESTTQFSCRQAADMTVRTLLKVDGEAGEEVVLLPGDQVQVGNCDACTPIGQPKSVTFEAGSVEVDGSVGAPIARVHVMNLGNILFEGQRAFVAENTWDLERTRLGELIRSEGGSDVYAYDAAFKLNACGQEIDFSNLRNFLSALVTLQDRVYPPLPLRPTSDFTDLSSENSRWDDALASRRYAWSVLYRFDHDYVCRTIQDPCGDGRYELRDIGETRVITMYYVTLRRPKSTARYARQDPSIVPHPDPREAEATEVQALGADKDLMFPVPWRVQVLFPDDKVIFSKSDPSRTYVPTEISVNHRDARIDRTQPSWATGLFDRGTMFIDELTGSVYRVEKARLSDDDQTAHLTLDREVVLEDVDFGDCDLGKDGNLKIEERLRTVWVFPPPVQGGRGAGDPLVFDGSPPVVDIAVQTVMIAP